MKNADKLQIIRELQTVQKILLTTTRNITSHDIRNIHDDYNKKIWSELTTCTHGTQQNFNERLDYYIEKLINQSIHELLRCLMSLDNFIRNMTPNRN